MRMFTVLVTGEFGLYCPAHLRAEPYTEPVITPAAASGLLRSMYWKPQFNWAIGRIRVLNPIRYETIKRSGIAQDRYTSGYGRTAGVREPRDVKAVQQIQTVLRDVAYVLDAYIVLNPSAMDPARGRDLHVVERIVEYELGSGRVYGSPHAGRSEFKLGTEFLPDGYAGPTIPDSMDLGPMLIGMTPRVPGGSLTNQWRPHYARLRMESGNVVVPASAYNEIMPALDRESGGLARAGKFAYTPSQSRGAL